MFDIGFWELTLLAVIALIVLGPERLPVVARTTGKWIGRAKGYVRGLTSELEREVNADEIRQQINRTREQIEADTHEAIGNSQSDGEPSGESQRKPDRDGASGAADQDDADRPDGAVEYGDEKPFSIEEARREHAQRDKESQW